MLHSWEKPPFPPLYELPLWQSPTTCPIKPPTSERFNHPRYKCPHSKRDSIHLCMPSSPHLYFLWPRKQWIKQQGEASITRTALEPRCAGWFSFRMSAFNMSVLPRGHLLDCGASTWSGRSIVNYLKIALHEQNKLHADLISAGEEGKVGGVGGL